MKKTLALILLLAGLTLEAQGRTLTWNGTIENYVWDTTTANWLDEDGNAAVFQNGDDVVFDDSSYMASVTLEGSLAPGNVTVNTGKHYYVGVGAHGHLTGSMQLIKNGSGTLEIHNDNSYTGGTVLNDGTIKMYNDQALSTGGIMLYGGTLNLLGKTIDSDNVTLKGSASIDEGVLSVRANNTFTLGGSLSGSVLIDLGNGAMLDLGGNAIDSNKLSLQGSATIGSGTIDSGLAVGENKSLTLLANTTITGGISLGDNATLYLGLNTISSSVNLQGSATIGNGTINSNLAVERNKNLTLLLNTTIAGHIELSGTLDLGGNAIDSNKLSLQGSATIGNGTIDSGLAVGESKILTLLENTTITGRITLGNGAMLDLGQNTISSSVTLKGSATIGNGSIYGNLDVQADKSLTLLANTSITGGITLGDEAMLDLGGNSIDNNKLTLQGSASIGNGTINGNLAVGDSKSLTLLENTIITGETTLGDNSTMDLGGNSIDIDSDITLQGSATIGNGVINSNLAVGVIQSLTLLPNTSITGSISMGDHSTMDLGGNSIDSSVTLQGRASIGNGVIGGSIGDELVVAHDMRLSFLKNASITSSVILGDNATLDLGQNTLYTSVTLEGSASIGNGTIKSRLTVETGNNLTLLTNTTITGGISLVDDASLDLGQNTISSSVTLQGSASIGNGALNSDLAVAAGKELWLYYGNLTGSGTINLGNGATLYVGTGGYNMGCGISGSGTIVMNADSRTASLSGSMKDFSGSVEVQMRGTLNIMNIDEAAKLNVADVTIAADGVLGVYKGETAGEASEGVLTITGGHKLTAGKDSRLNADLVMGGGVEAPAVLDVSANLGDGGLDMGSTVTLNPGSVLLSDADMKAIGALDFMGKYDLFNGVDGLSVDGTTDFLSELGLADKWVKAADVFANPELSAEKDYYLFYSGVNRGGVGGNVGTVYLMQIPEPTTGTLSLLALAALAARRRKR